MNFYAKITYPRIFPLEGFGDETLTVTNKLLVRNGKPWMPFMGEMQYSRVPREKWR